MEFTRINYRYNAKIYRYFYGLGIEKGGRLSKVGYFSKQLKKQNMEFNRSILQYYSFGWKLKVQAPTHVFVIPAPLWKQNTNGNRQSVKSTSVRHNTGQQKKISKPIKYRVSLILGRWFRIWQSFFNLWSRFCSVASFAVFWSKITFSKIFRNFEKNSNFSFLI